MPAKAKVFVHYGPYDSCGTVNHSITRLQGLQFVLEKDGHTVELVQMEDWNCVELMVHGEKIFSCDIRELDFGSDGQLDPLCSKALEAVQKAF